MDHEDFRQRSASSSSLQSTYRAHGGSRNFSTPRQAAQKRPYHSLNETSAILRSPGPLESMLKTTTETGDIGIFSIKPSPSSLPHRRPPRPSYDTADATLHSRPPSTRPENRPPFDDRRILPSYRDTASEIISLYGSSSQLGFSRSLSPHDNGQRSYSMSTCSSRRMPLHKSSTTLQSMPSMKNMQRPRSPFPYPTRLKRPGVRSASPAMTESGIIDYARMAELRRFPDVRVVSPSLISSFELTSSIAGSTALQTGVRSTSPARTTNFTSIRLQRVHVFFTFTNIPGSVSSQPWISSLENAEHDCVLASEGISQTSCLRRPKRSLSKSYLYR